MIVAIIIPYHDDRCVRSFTTSLKSTGWCLFSTKTTFPTHGDTILSSCHIIIGIHSLCASTVEPLTLKSPPPSLPHPISLSRWEPFNRPEHSMSLAKDDDDFICQDVKFTATPTEPTVAIPPGVLVKYYLPGHRSDESMLAGAAMVSLDGLCPPFDASPNKNMFQHLFGIEFHYENHSHVRGISLFEFARCFGFSDDLTYRLSQPVNRFCLDAAVPGRTLEWLFDQVHAHLTIIRNLNCEIFRPNQFAAPAATIQAFGNGAIGARLPSHTRWVEAYAADAECCMIRDLRDSQKRPLFLSPSYQTVTHRDRRRHADLPRTYSGKYFLHSTSNRSIRLA